MSSFVQKYPYLGGLFWALRDSAGPQTLYARALTQYVCDRTLTEIVISGYTSPDKKSVGKSPVFAKMNFPVRFPGGTLKRLVELHTVTPIFVEVEADSDDALIAGAILLAQARHPQLTSDTEYVRYVLRERRLGGQPTDTPWVYHDRNHLDRLHEERIDEALVFDFDEIVDAGLSKVVPAVSYRPDSVA
jgi:hypothetical protein